MGLIGEIIVKSNIDKTKNIYSIKEKLWVIKWKRLL
jgi:hypothetical protein